MATAHQLLPWDRRHATTALALWWVAGRELREGTDIGIGCIQQGRRRSAGPRGCRLQQLHGNDVPASCMLRFA